MKFCGPKFSLCGVIISIWGIIQLASMGIFYYFKSVALLEDLPIEESYSTPHEFYTAAEAGYKTNAMNCWIAACLYVFTLAFSSYQFYVNSRTHV
ncbi:ribonuclease kappa-B [Halyomorpha halys]|uniref:ribonuclease kappa-B n=1 Tax=Halyomorpha halys TaxID=286706 RepID=UPI0006D4FF0C|nr:ribonuclease kappa-B-like [Halyomorpha halys]